MPPRPKKNGIIHRLVCRCEARECRLGQFLDAHGTLQHGVEVAPETQEAHAFLDRRAQARSHSQRIPTSVSPHKTPVLTRRTSTAHDVDLSSRFSHLGIATPNSRSSSDRSMLVQAQFPQQTFPVNEQNGRLSGSVERDYVEVKTCPEAILAWNLGVQVYKCGDYLFLSSEYS